ncbi:MAG: type II secretion system protein [Candidatus Omnitrophota bacterium]
MRGKTLYNNRGFTGLLELLAVLAIIGILVYFMMKRVTTAPVMDKETQKTVSEAGIDTGNYRSVVDTTRSTLKEISEKEQKQLDQITREAAYEN